MADYTLNALLTHTFMNYHKTLVDNIGKRRPVLAAMKAVGGTETRSGGEGHGGHGAVVVPILTGLNSSHKWLGNKFDDITVTYQDGMEAASYDWALSVCPVIISWIEQINNTGKAKIMDLLRDKIKQTELTISTKIEQALTGHASVHITSEDNAPTGLCDLVFPYNSDDGGSGDLVRGAVLTAWNTFGNINRATTANAYWRNQVKEFTSSANIEDELRSLMMDCQAEGGLPNIGFCDKIGFDRLAKREFAKREYSVTGKVGKPSIADLGFPTLAFNGATFTWSSYISNPADGLATEGIIYVLNTEFTKVTTDPKANHKFFPFEGVKGDSNQLVSQALYVHRYALTTSNSRANGVLFNIE